MIAQSSSRVNWSSAPNGSSSSSSRGSWISARQRLARCIMPPESCQGILVAEARQADLRQQRLDPVAVLALALGAVVLPEGRHDLQRQHHVVADGEPGQHGRVLEGHADADRRRADLAPGDEDVAGGGR